MFTVVSIVNSMGYAGGNSFLCLKVLSDLAPIIPTCCQQVGSKNMQSCLLCYVVYGFYVMNGMLCDVGVYVLYVYVMSMYVLCLCTTLIPFLSPSTFLVTLLFLNCLLRCVAAVGINPDVCSSHIPH